MTRFATILLLSALCGCQQSAPSADPAPMADTVAGDSAFVLPGDFSQSTSITDLQKRGQRIFRKRTLKQKRVSNGNVL